MGGERSTSTVTESAWRIVEWNPEGRAYICDPPEGMERVYFVVRNWVDARDMARGYFGRDIPNEAKWENGSWAFVAQRGEDQLRYQHVQVSRMEYGMLVEVFPQAETLPPIVEAPRVDSTRPPAEGNGAHAEAPEDIDDGLIPF